MSNITDYILSKTARLKVSPEISPGDHGFMMFNDAGTEVEVSEFLYSFTRMLKPKLVLETGTHIGVSSVYIGQALKDNGSGKVITFEIIPPHHRNAKLLWEDVGIQDYVDGRLLSGLKYEPGDQIYDMLFLDSEPQIRFAEFTKFWDSLRPGGFIIIHDLNCSLGHHGQTYHGIYNWPWGDFRESLGPYIERQDVQVISFDTPRGLTIFQKVRDDFAFAKHLKGEL